MELDLFVRCSVACWNAPRISDHKLSLILSRATQPSTLVAAALLLHLRGGARRGARALQQQTMVARVRSWHAACAAASPNSVHKSCAIHSPHSRSCAFNLPSAVHLRKTQALLLWQCCSEVLT